MPPYNLSLIGNETGLVPMMQAVNDNLMFGWFGAGILITLGIILIMAFTFRTGDSNKAIVASSYIVFVISFIFRAMGLVNDLTPLITLIIAALATGVTYMTK